MSDQPKWTPGPWRAVMGSRHVVDVFAGDRDVVSVYGGGVGFEYRDANAHLIAAAPDLYAALETLSALNDDSGPFGGEIYQDRVDRAWSAARAALAKARGES